VFLWLVSVVGLPAAVRLGYVHQLGGNAAETVAAMTRDSAGNLYVTGKTYSYDFPASVLQLHPGGSNLWRAAGLGAAPSPIYSHLASNVFSIADRAHPGVIFLWTNRGLLRSGDYGNTWTANSSGLPDPRGGMLAIDPRDGRNLYPAAPASGIFKSTDAGATWTTSNAGIAANRAGYFPDQIFLDPWNPAVLFASDGFDFPKLYRSADAGASWQLQSAAIRSVAFDTRHAGLAYGAGSSQLLRSVDDGATWSALNAPASSFSYVATDSGGSVYYTSPSFVSGVTVSRDGGVTWTNQQVNGYVSALAADPDSPAVYVATDSQVLASADGFATTSRVSVPTPVSLFGLAPSTDPHAPDQLFAGAASSTSDAYAMKLDASGNPVWATYLGGSQDDAGTGIAVDGAGNVYVAGTTNSSDFPATPGALTPNSGAGNFVAKISGDGRLVYSATFTDGGPIAAVGSTSVAASVGKY